MRWLRVATLNVWNLSDPYPRRRRIILEELSRLNVDVLALQEVVEEPDGGPSQAADLAAQDGYHVAYASEGSYRSRTIGNALLSRYPIERTGVLLLPPDDGGSLIRNVLRAELRLPEGLLHVFCTHLSYGPDQGRNREQQVIAVDDFMREARGGLPRILLGDFNAAPDSAEIRFLTGGTSLGKRTTSYQDAAATVGHPEPTWASANPFAEPAPTTDRRIDYVFVSPEEADGSAKIRSCGLAFAQPDETGCFASDHFGVTAEVEVHRSIG